MRKRKILIDCDPGIDDSLALMMALSSPELDVVGITTVCGNVPPHMGAENALKLLKFMDRLDIPVYCGEAMPLVREYVSAQDTHGMDGLGESGLETVTEAEWKDGAVDFILETLRTEEQLSIIAIGPLTNIAKALMKDPAAFERIDTFVSMGGSYKSHGNCSPVAEYNYWCDPDAAEYVYKNLGTKIHMVGLDVTRKIVLTPNILEYMKILDKKKGELIEAVTRFYFDFHWKYEGVIGCVINDPLAAAYFIKPDLCSGFDAYTAVETKGICIGQTVVDGMDFWHKSPNSHILTGVNAKEFMVMFLNRIFGGNCDEIRKVLDQIMVSEEADYEK
ncbi:nucleoside hydrolase [Clostridium sp. MCC353]|uniref:nucleoside hydrolase n=1 Tax=Clostridium sp. MCC353 TaxID=2592646 RepID=UPI001C01ED25|nr:nucleoside hydrolase [Clostridium sp. MCC353]MBT9777784.1 nucleoside hydrolase [Clostridium sp. MCC353]